MTDCDVAIEPDEDGHPDGGCLEDVGEGQHVELDWERLHVRVDPGRFEQRREGVEREDGDEETESRPRIDLRAE